MKKWGHNSKGVLEFKVDEEFTIKFFKTDNRTKRYCFNISPVVPKGKKQRLYTVAAFPGSVSVVFKDVK